MFVEIAVRDTGRFIENFENQVVAADQLTLDTAIAYFLNYYIEHEAQ